MELTPMRRQAGFRVSFVVASIATLGVCSGCGSQIGIVVSPSELYVEVGGTTTVNVLAVMSLGSPTPVSGAVTITSSDAAVADVSGLVITGLAEGSVLLTITDGTFTTAASVTVVAAGSIPAGLVVAPTSITCTSESEPIQLEVFAVFASGSSEDITDAASFSSSNSPVALVTPEGVVVCVSPGTAVIRVAYLGRTGSANVTVGSLPPSSVNVIPASVICAVGDTVSVQVVAIEVGGTPTDATRTAGYLSSDNSVATASAGQIGCVTEGTATITVNVSGVLGTVEVEVRTAVGGPDEVVGLRFLPTALSCGVTGSPAFVLIAEFGDGTSEDVTNALDTTYQSLNPSVAKILSNQVVCVQRGQTIIRAEFAGLLAVLGDH